MEPQIKLNTERKLTNYSTDYYPANEIEPHKTKLEVRYDYLHCINRFTKLSIALNSETNYRIRFYYMKIKNVCKMQHGARRYLLEEIWQWNPCLDEFVGRGEFQFGKRVAVRIRPWRCLLCWWKEACDCKTRESSRNLHSVSFGCVTNLQGLFCYLFKRGGSRPVRAW